MCPVYNETYRHVVLAGLADNSSGSIESRCFLECFCWIRLQNIIITDTRTVFKICTIQHDTSTIGRYDFITIAMPFEAAAIVTKALSVKAILIFAQIRKAHKMSLLLATELHDCKHAC